MRSLTKLIVAAAELAVLQIKANSLLPAVGGSEQIGWSLAPIRGVLRFSLAVAFTSTLWVLVTQLDKLVLSRLLTLQNYGYFSLAVVIAGSVLIATGPISTVLIPRLTYLAAKGDEAGMLQIYGRATRVVSAIAFPVAFVLATFAGPVVWAWTGDARAAQEIAPILQPYALGNAVMAVGAFPAYLQFAHGDLRLHLIGSVLFVVALLPSLIAGVWKFGAVGAGWAWLGTNVVYFFLWVPVVHGKLAPGLHSCWLGRDVLVAAGVAAGSALLIESWIKVPELSRVEAGLVPLSVGAGVLLLTSLPILWAERPKKLRFDV